MGPSPPARTLGEEDIVVLCCDDQSRAIRLSNRNPKALGLRLHAFASAIAAPRPRGCCVELHLRPRRSWISDDDLADVERGDTFFHISDATFRYSIGWLSLHRNALRAAGKMLESLGLDAGEEKIESWKQSVALFVRRAAKEARKRKAAEMRMVIEISAKVMSNPYEDKDVLDEEAEEEEEEYVGEVCAVCLEELEEWCAEAARLPCCHAFHWGCLVEWFKCKQQCPCCREDCPQTPLISLN